MFRIGTESDAGGDRDPELLGQLRCPVQGAEDDRHDVGFDADDDHIALGDQRVIARSGVDAQACFELFALLGRQIGATEVGGRDARCDQATGQCLGHGTAADESDPVSRKSVDTFAHLNPSRLSPFAQAVLEASPSKARVQGPGSRPRFKA